MGNNNIMSCLGLSYGPRWIELEPLDWTEYNFMCSNCGAKWYAPDLPKICPECKARMKG